MKKMVLMMLCVVLAFSSAGEAQRRRRGRGRMPVEFTDATVESAIQRGVKYLFSVRNADGSWPAYGDPKHRMWKTGPTALAIYALLETGISAKDDRIAKSLDWLEKNAKDDKMTYSVGLRCCVWHLANRDTNGKYKKILGEDAGFLIKVAPKGFYAYEASENEPFDYHYDNSNSQYGVLGVWAAARERGSEIPKKYWQLVMKHWLAQQRPDGGWVYRIPRSDNPDKSILSRYRDTMTVAGLASLFVCVDNLYGKKYISCKGAGKEMVAINKGMDWMEKNFHPEFGGEYGQDGHRYYYIYGVERVGLASGYKYFGKHDWYKCGVKWLLPNQERTGQFGRDCVQTSYALLFLIRGRNPVIFNRLDYEGDWNNRPRALAMLTRWMGRMFENTLNWQIINLKAPVSEWHDAPMLLITGSKKPTFSDADIKKLREYVLQGGTIVSSTECGGAVFKKEIRKVYRKMFPKYELVRCSRKHPIYTHHFKKYTKRGQPALYEISNGVRPFVIHTDKDIVQSWQMRKWNTGRRDFEIVTNIALYVGETFKKLRRRGITHWPEAKDYPTRRNIDIVKVQYKGNSDPEPLAWDRMSKLLAKNEQIKVNLSIIDMEKLATCKAKVAVLTGTGGMTFTPEQTEAVKKYVESGGTLIVDAAGGKVKFYEDALKMLENKLGERADTIEKGSAIYTRRGKEIKKVHFRKKTRKRLLSADVPRVKGIKVKGKLRVFISREDLTGGLVGMPSGVIDGYDPEDAYKVMRNLILHAMGK